MDIIAFGAGEESRKVLSFLETKYHILFFSDNDGKKQGTFIQRYIINSPEEIKRYTCDIVITSLKYASEIETQLLQMGISRDRLYICRKFSINSVNECEVCPVEPERVESTELSLIQYDLCYAKECETANKKVMVFCIFYSTYTKQLIENMSRRCSDIEFSLLTKADEYKETIQSEKLKHIYCFHTMADIKTILEQLPQYDAMQLLWIEQEWAYFYKLIRKKTRYLNLNVGGSDFYRVGETGRNFSRNLITCADNITAETETTVQEFGEYYGQKVKNKTRLLPFGIEVLEWIDFLEEYPKNMIKERYHIPDNKIVVTCGHNANGEHQHMKIIDALEKLSENIKKQVIFVFPMAYPQGADVYIGSVDSRLKESGLEYKILTKFMDFKEMAEYALISDVLIHVQTTDQLSSTMLEEMYAGSMVITGRWLPYQSLHEMGIFFRDVDTIPDITKLLEDIVMNMEEYRKKCKRNKVIVGKHSARDELAPRWHALWE